MCSVFVCDSGRRGAQRFKLPEDPERRLEWVQFLATVNKQRFKESSWTDITICSEHFKDVCFEKPTPSRAGLTATVPPTLKPGAVPSLCLHSEPDEPESNLESPKCVPVETTEDACQHDQLKTCDGPTSCSEESRPTSRAAQGSPVPRGVSCSTDTFISVHGQMQQNNMNNDLIREKAALLKMKGKYVVNEKRLLQLFNCKCPSCGCKLRMEKVTYGVLVILNQQCPLCEYRYQWKSQVNASVPTAGGEHLSGGSEVSPETKQAAPADDTYSSIPGVPEIVAIIDEESDAVDETEESSDQGDMGSDEDWKPVKDLLLATVPQKETDRETEDEEEDEEYPPLVPKHSQLCTECGLFFNKRKPHTCEHKIKPYSCNICGKRCVSEVALNSHSRIHDESYEHRCKYCHATFKTKVDKHTHEHTHLIQGKPYKCPDCSETFATNKERRTHLEDHRGPRQLKCHICGIEFNRSRSLQRHLAVHTGLKPYKCSVCHRGFNQASHLRSHMRLHTGERPFKCQHCDKCFNHNVSLKSHVQRYHSPSPGRQWMKGKNKQSVRDTDDAQENANKRGSDSGFENIEEKRNKEEKVQKEITNMPKSKKRSTGRPIGRPKRNAAGNLVVAGEMQGQCSSSNTKTAKVKVRKLKRRHCSNEDGEDQPPRSHTSFDPSEEEGERREIVTSSTSRSRGRAKASDSDSDFDPEGSKKRKYSSQNRRKSLGRRRGRPRKDHVVEDT